MSSRKQHSSEGLGSGWERVARGGGDNADNPEDSVWSFPSQLPPPGFEHLDRNIWANMGDDDQSSPPSLANLSASVSGVSSPFSSSRSSGQRRDPSQPPRVIPARFAPNRDQEHSRMSFSMSNSNQLAVSGLQPKATLAGWFGKTFRVLINKDNYNSWHDGGMPHKLRFTAVFFSPTTGEYWLSGEYGDSNNYQVQRFPNGSKIVWYARKTFAEHGAAARAFDCLSLRHHERTGSPFARIGVEEPYHTPQDAPPLPPNLPNEVRAKIDDFRRQAVAARSAAQASAPVPEVVLSTGNETSETEDQHYRDDYRRSRREAFRRSHSSEQEWHPRFH